MEKLSEPVVGMWFEVRLQKRITGGFYLTTELQPAKNHYIQQFKQAYAQDRG